MLRALIVDDEEPARERLRRLLEKSGDVEIVGEAGDGEDAMDKIAALAPDVVFLDIHMLWVSGMEVAASLATPVRTSCSARRSTSSRLTPSS